MVKKTISIIFLIAAGFLFFLAARGFTYLGPPAVNGDIDTLKNQAIQYIRQNKQIDANSAIKTLLTNYTTDAKFAAVTYELAELYRSLSKFQKALELYTVSASVAQSNQSILYSKRGEIICNIALGKLDTSNELLEKLKNDYSAVEPNKTAEVVFNIGDAHYWLLGQRGYKDANNCYLWVVQNCPESDYAAFSTMSLAICCLAGKDYKTADLYINSLYEDFAENPRQTEALFWVASRLGFDKKQEAANEIYSYLAENYPDSSWGKNSLFESSKLEVVHYVDVNDEPNTIKSIDKLINNFNRPERQTFVYEMASRIDQKNKNEPNGWTDELLNRVVAIDSNSVSGKKATANKIRLGIIGVVSSDGDINNIILGVERITNDFNRVPDTEDNLRMICTKLTGKGHNYRIEKNEKKSVESFQIAIWIRQQIVTKYPNSPTHASAYYVTGVDYAQNLRDYEKGIEYFKTVVQNWPEWHRAWNAQFNIARYYEMIKARDKIKDVQYDLKIIDAYKTGVEKFSDCEAVDFGVIRIASLYYGINQFTEAAVYYEKYLGKRPDDLKNVILNYGDCLEKTGRKEEVKILYIEYLKTADTYDKAISVIKQRIAKLGGNIQ